MPVEIRELIIKTTLESHTTDRDDADRAADLSALRRDLLDECERMLRAFQDRWRSAR